MTWEVRTGDCVDLMAAMEPASVDAVVCDPPYGLEFMGKEWDRLGDSGRLTHTGPRDRDGSTVFGRQRVSYRGSENTKCRRCRKWTYDYPERKCTCPTPDVDRARQSRVMQEWHEAWATEALRVLKPGGHLLAFGGTRTSHRLVCAIEDAGFEIRDTICWMYGSGFPKSLDVGKAIDKANGAEREVTRAELRPLEPGPFISFDQRGSDERERRDVPATPDAERWQGWGTALKPAHEPIVVARKPLSGTVAQTVLEHGTGGLNVDGCRVEASDAQLAEKYASVRNAGPRANAIYGQDGRDRSDGRLEPHEFGRWPANVALDEEASRLLDEQSGERASGKMMPTKVQSGSRTVFGQDAAAGYTTIETYGDSGGASRFFYTAKASRAERNAGLDGFEEQRGPVMSERCVNCGHGRMDGRREGACCESPEYENRPAAGLVRNHHPTVKPVNLMRWLVRLVTPPDGIVLDPFAGSGTTGIAAVLEGFSFLGLERDEGYADIARARIGWWAKHGHDALRIVAEQEAAENEREAVRESGQLELL